MSEKPVEQEISRNITWSMELISTLEETMRDSELLLARVRQYHDAQQLLCSSRYIRGMSKRQLRLSDHSRNKPASSSKHSAQSDIEL